MIGFRYIAMIRSFTACVKNKKNKVYFGKLFTNSKYMENGGAKAPGMLTSADIC
jgi:hypothetical protein